MSETVAQPAPLPRPRRRWVRVLLMLVIFCSGMVVGVGLTVGTVVRQAKQNLAHPELQPMRWTQRLTRRLDLNEAESAAVGRIMQDSWDRMTPLRKDAGEQIRAEVERLDQEVAAAISAEKANRWHDYVQNIRENWLPRE